MWGDDGRDHVKQKDSGSLNKPEGRSLETRWPGPDLVQRQWGWGVRDQQQKRGFRCGVHTAVMTHIWVRYYLEGGRTVDIKLLCVLIFKKWQYGEGSLRSSLGTSLVVQWLRLCPPNAGGRVCSLVGEQIPHATVKSSHAITKTWSSQMKYT